MLTFRVSWLVAICLFVTSCVTDGAAETGENIYYKTQSEADAALAAFDKENPSCQLWTNWQKMCSRTGPDGKTYCVTDPDRPVRPSVPFCAESREEADYDLSALTILQKSSFARFCSAKGGLDLPTTLADRLCPRNDKKSFSVLTLAARRHPWCGAWGLADQLRGTEMKLICQEKSWSKDVPECGSIKSKKIYREGLYCAKWQTPTWCTTPEGLLGGWQIGQPKPDPEEYIVAIGLENAGNYPVRGVYCGEETK